MKLVFGFKKYMSQTWDEAGHRLPVSVIATEPMMVTQVKHLEPDGYEAVQIGFGVKSKARITKPLLNHLKKTGQTKPVRFLREIRLSEPSTLALGDTIKPEDMIQAGDLCAVRGTTKGRGFTGVMKRHGFKGGPKTHGQSDRARAPGSIGQGTSPGRIHKGKRMAGHSGNTTKWLKNISVIKIDPEKQEIWLKGPLPGARGSLVSIEVLRSQKDLG